MPWGDGTGPWWAQGRGWRCLGPRYWWRRYYLVEPVNLTKEEQKKILEQAKADLELELKQIEEKLKELR
jgi:hypothetical protein